MTAFSGRRTASSVLLLTIIVLIITMAVCVFEAKSGLVVGRQPIQFDLSLLDDGIYRGTYGMAGSQYAVDITIEAHRIKGITVIKGPQRVFTQKCGLCEAKDMIREAIETQALPVDAYSGATQTTTAIIRAVEAALKSPFEGSDDAFTYSEAWR